MVLQSDERYDDAWRFERFMATLEQQAGISPAQVERATRATLETLAERLSEEELMDLAKELPSPLRPWLEGAGMTPKHGEGSPHVEEFIRRVAQREGVDAETAARHARAVFVALARVVPAHEVDYLVARLPHEFEPFLGDVAARLRDAREPEVRSADEFLRRVERRSGLDRPAARRATEAVLETLAERIAGGQVDDLVAVLPEELSPPLLRGRARTRGNARRMALDEFVARVAEREVRSFDDALEDTRAVFLTLREALPPKEVSDILAQLPRGYREALL